MLTQVLEAVNELLTPAPTQFVVDAYRERTHYLREYRRDQ